MEANVNPQPGGQVVTVAAFSAKFRSKGEVYSFLTLDVKAYLPAQNTITAYFLRDLISGKKKCKSTNFFDTPFVVIPMAQVIHVTVPYYLNLSLAEVFRFVDGHEEVMRHLPDDRELRKAPRQWMLNVIATILQKPFLDWVKQRIDERNASVIEEHQLGIAMESSVAAAFQASTAVSRKSLFFCGPHLNSTVRQKQSSRFLTTFVLVKNGIGANMMKISAKRRRPPAEVKAEREGKQAAEAELQAKRAELEALEARLNGRKEQVDNALAAERILNDLINSKQVKRFEDGSWGQIPPDQQMEK